MSSAFDAIEPLAIADSRPAKRRTGNLLGVSMGIVLLLLLILAIFGEWLAPLDPQDQDLLARLVPPFWSSGGSTEHLLGTDSLGRDMLSRLIVGTQTTLLIGFCGALLEALIGVVLGVLAGYFGGKTDAIIMRITDIQIGFPGALVVLFVILIFGGGPVVIFVALAINGWMVFARVVRVSVMRLRTEGFVEAAVASGVRSPSILRWHIFPHITGTVVTLFLFEVPRIILAESTLSFIGLGIQPPDVSWGLMIGAGRSSLQTAPYPSILPGVMIVLTVLSMNLFSTWLSQRTEQARRS